MLAGRSDEEPAPDPTNQRLKQYVFALVCTEVCTGARRALELTRKKKLGKQELRHKPVVGGSHHKVSCSVFAAKSQVSAILGLLSSPGRSPKSFFSGIYFLLVVNFPDSCSGSSCGTQRRPDVTIWHHHHPHHGCGEGERARFVSRPAFAASIAV